MLLCVMRACIVPLPGVAAHDIYRTLHHHDPAFWSATCHADPTCICPVLPPRGQPGLDPGRWPGARRPRGWLPTTHLQAAGASHRGPLAVSELQVHHNWVFVPQALVDTSVLLDGQGRLILTGRAHLAQRPGNSLQRCLGLRQLVCTSVQDETDVAGNVFSAKAFLPDARNACLKTSAGNGTDTSDRRAPFGESAWSL
mgnify:CR=1 FL=1